MRESTEYAALQAFVLQIKMHFLMVSVFSLSGEHVSSGLSMTQSLMMYSSPVDSASFKDKSNFKQQLTTGRADVFRTKKL